MMIYMGSMYGTLALLWNITGDGKYGQWTPDQNEFQTQSIFSDSHKGTIHIIYR